MQRTSRFALVTVCFTALCCVRVEDDHSNLISCATRSDIHSDPLSVVKAAFVYMIIGTLLVVMALSMTVLQRLPLTTSLSYLVVGILLGPFFLGMIQLDPIQQPALLEKVTEVAVVISLFTTGLKLRLPLSDKGSPNAALKHHAKPVKLRGGASCGLLGTSIPAATSAFCQDPKIRSAAENSAE
jgi:hypothetical protein